MNLASKRKNLPSSPAGTVDYLSPPNLSLASTKPVIQEREIIGRVYLCHTNCPWALSVLPSTQAPLNVWAVYKIVCGA